MNYDKWRWLYYDSAFFNDETDIHDLCVFEYTNVFVCVFLLYISGCIRIRNSCK